MKNYYKILQVNKTASQEVISKVYKFLAKKYHPDANPDNKELAEERFKEISEAHEILSDVNKRQNYDIQLEEYEKNLLESPKLQELQNYCAKLEEEIEILRAENNNQRFESAQYYNEIEKQNLEFERIQRQAQTEGIQNAYNTAYVDTLKNMGYKIKYKQSFKQRCKNLLSLILTITIVAIILRILWNVPAIREFLMPVYDLILLFKP